MKDASAADLAHSLIEPLARMSDLDEYRQGLDRHLGGDWDEERFTAFRVRFGVYGQRQPGVQMVRIKIPGGVLRLSWLRTIASINREFCAGDAHITTRQDVQIYSVPLRRTPELLERLYAAGLTTREACGNTLRNVTACALAGICPREHVDAGAVAERLARSWLRNPLVQHMPRKVKMSVSGCATDCGAASIHDLAFVAVEKNGRQGFRVHAGGGLGATPRSAVEVLDFVAEEELPTVVEAMARLHQRYSDRRLRNHSRFKFLVKRFGEDKFRALFAEEFARLRGLPQRPWEPLNWRRPGEALDERMVARTPVGRVAQHDGRVALVAAPPLGLLSSDQLDAVAAIAERAGLAELRTTRDQNLVLAGLVPEAAEKVAASLAAIGIPVPASPESYADIVSCPGTTTCRIGITSSQGFARELVAAAQDDPAAQGLSVRVSGCQNSCGLHHVGDFGFHGMAKKIDGRPAPHYQIHLGGDPRQGGAVALAGPVVPARHAGAALTLLRDGYLAGREPGESVRSWAERLGRPGIAGLLRPLEAKGGDDVFVDWGEAGDFAPPATAAGDCAAPFALDAVLADLADDALIGMDRALAVGRWQEALRAAAEATVIAARRLLLRAGFPTEDADPEALIVEAVMALGEEDGAVATLDALLGERMAALSSGRAEGYREALALWLDTVRAVVTGPGAPEGRPAAGGDFAAEARS